MSARSLSDTKRVAKSGPDYAGYQLANLLWNRVKLITPGIMGNSMFGVDICRDSSMGHKISR